MNLVAQLILLVLFAFIWYRLGYDKGRLDEMRKAKGFIDALLNSLEKNVKPVKRKHGRPVGSKNKPKV
jgi:hypothetical protein